MARERIRAAMRKVQRDETDEVAQGVGAVCRQIAPQVEEGALYWRGPFQYVAEQMAPRICKQHSLPLENVDDVATYLLAALNEYVVALAGEFDAEHFAAWISALRARTG